MHLPEKLYKYEPFTELSLRNLKRQVVYFGSPKGFNDPYDCAITSHVEEPTQEQIETYKNSLLDNKKISEESKLNIKSLPEQEFVNIVRRSIISINQEWREKFVSTCGITCLSEINNDLLMWSHYGGRYKGICLEFDSKQEPFNKAKKVIYSDSIPEISPLTLLANDSEKIFDLFCLKSKSWEYEKEWRVFHKVAGTLFTYPAEALTGVFFGPDIEPECLEIIALILKGQNEKVKLFRGTRSTNAFKVEYKEVNYTPFLEAKKLGIR